MGDLGADGGIRRLGGAARRCRGESLRPACELLCQYLGVATFDAVDIAVAPLRVAKTAVAQRVQVRQGDRAILEATVWSVGDVDGLAHDVTAPTRPPVPSPQECKDLTELLSEEDRADGPPFPFWRNLDSKPIKLDRRATRSWRTRLAGVAALRAHAHLQ